MVQPAKIPFVCRVSSIAHRGHTGKGERERYDSMRKTESREAEYTEVDGLPGLKHIMKIPLAHENTRRTRHDAPS